MIRRFVLVILVVALTVSAVPASAWHVAGKLETTEGNPAGDGDGQLIYGVNWQPASLSWDVTSSDMTVYHYHYTLDVSQADNYRAISHMVLEVTPEDPDDPMKPEFVLGYPDIYNLTAKYTDKDTGDRTLDPWSPTMELGEHEDKTGGQPCPLYGVKFEAPDDSEWVTLEWSFDAYRMPVWGDFYARDGNSGDVHLYNAGLCKDDLTVALEDQTYYADFVEGENPPNPYSSFTLHEGVNEIVRPNGRTPELPASGLLLLSMAPLGFAWRRWRKR